MDLLCLPQISPYSLFSAPQPKQSSRTSVTPCSPLLQTRQRLPHSLIVKPKVLDMMLNSLTPSLSALTSHYLAPSPSVPATPTSLPFPNLASRQFPVCLSCFLCRENPFHQDPHMADSLPMSDLISVTHSPAWSWGPDTAPEPNASRLLRMGSQEAPSQSWPHPGLADEVTLLGSPLAPG